MSNVDEILKLARTHVDELAAPGLDPRPRRKVAVLTCMDTRLEIAHILGIERGDAHIIRNAGGLVTDDAIRSLSISQRLLGTEEVIVIMHEGCGLQGSSEEDLAIALAANGPLPTWRIGAFEDLEKTLEHGLSLLRSSEHLSFRESIRGLVFDPENGILREVGATTSPTPASAESGGEIR
jgi:carbonic anhydrase